MFRAHVLIIRRLKLHYTASGIITPIGGRLVRRFEGSKCPHLRSRSVYQKVPYRKIWVPSLSFRPTCPSWSAWPQTGKYKDSSKDLKFLYIYEFLSYLTLTKRSVLVLKQECYRNVEITEPGIGWVLPKCSFQTPSLKFCVILHSDSSHTWEHQITS